MVAPEALCQTSVEPLFLSAMAVADSMSLVLRCSLKWTSDNSDLSNRKRFCVSIHLLLWKELPFNTLLTSMEQSLDHVLICGVAIAEWWHIGALIDGPCRAICSPLSCPWQQQGLMASLPSPQSEFAKQEASVSSNTMTEVNGDPRH